MNKSQDAGTFELIDPGSDKIVTRMRTVMCVHCGKHWIPEPGSGKLRGFCARCNGLVCGPGCEKCVPMEQMLENIEKGRAIDFCPIIVPTSFSGE